MTLTSSQKVRFEESGGVRVAHVLDEHYHVLGDIEEGVPQGDASVGELVKWLEQLLAADDAVAVVEQGRPFLTVHFG